jgi:hypothetical protein
VGEAVYDTFKFEFVLKGVVRFGPGNVAAERLYFVLAKNVRLSVRGPPRLPSTK